MIINARPVAKTPVVTKNPGDFVGDVGTIAGAGSADSVVVAGCPRHRIWQSRAIAHRQEARNESAGHTGEYHNCVSGYSLKQDKNKSEGEEDNSTDHTVQQKGGRLEKSIMEC